MSKLGHFSPIPVSCLVAYVGLFAYCEGEMGNGKCRIFIPFHSYEDIPTLFPFLQIQSSSSHSRDSSKLRITGRVWGHTVSAESEPIPGDWRLGPLKLNTFWVITIWRSGKFVLKFVFLPNKNFVGRLEAWPPGPLPLDPLV